MAELIDDLERRGGDAFSDRPFQELDGALLARLAYLPFEHTALASRSGWLRPLRCCCKRPRPSRT